jgi:hypothetical protein
MLQNRWRPAETPPPDPAALGGGSTVLSLPQSQSSGFALES